MRLPSSQTKTIGARLGDAVLSILAVAGGISIILVILGFSLNVSIMMFRTGSMEPTIPAGSIAVVKEIPATDITKGDVITVNRGDELLPITHRVTEIHEVNSVTGEVTFTMRGDANDTDDPDPYTATTVQRALFSVPGIAPFIQSLQNPLVLGSLTLGATVLVIWAFWPRSEDAPDSQPHGARRVNALALPLLVAVLASTSAEENISTEKISGEYLHLQSYGDRAKMTNMMPGQPVVWAIDVWAEAPEPGAIDLELSAIGQLISHPDELHLEIVICTPHPSAKIKCHPEGSLKRKILDVSQLIGEGSGQSLGTISSDETRRVLVTATLADSPPKIMQSLSADLRFNATGYDERLSAGPLPASSDRPTTPSVAASELSETGLNALGTIALAVLFILGGFRLLTQRVRTSNNEGRDSHN